MFTLITSRLSKTCLPTEKVLDRASYIDYYLVILLLVFFDVKLLEVLIKMTKTTKTKDIPKSCPMFQRSNSFKDQTPESIEVKKKASLLIAEILDQLSRVLPLHYGTRIQFLPRLFESLLKKGIPETNFICKNPFFMLRGRDSKIYDKTDSWNKLYCIGAD
ncbi:hypothetical protein PPACK8108_LOCUS18571 [Phakopsora pachyrhizi]|uniref:Uncharacterized protein n=1 Tax=Phakopsora pachyrhizi TaxID=170000 RepID=A0AAV0BB78_PHAPC|nr:hypothetical protein PPACK8108_LOCUS18571 [Phakopsora pachyrhizi]